MKYNAIIIDDERLARLALKKELERFPEIVILGEAPGIKAAKSLIEKTDPNLLFLDIQLADGDGFDLLNQIDYSGKVIFVTAYDQYAIRAFEINAIDYLLKPISSRRLQSAINKLSLDHSQSTPDAEPKLIYTDRLMVTHRKSVNFIKISSIASIIASREYSNIFTFEGKQFISSRSIGHWEARLPDENFCRIHRGTIINFDAIMKIDHTYGSSAKVSIQGHAEPLNISRSYFKKLRDRYSL